MKTPKFLIIAMIAIALLFPSCKQVAGGDYYPSGSCSIDRIHFYSSDNVLVYYGGSSGTVTGTYVQNGNTVTITTFGTYIHTFQFDGAGCLVEEGFPNCKFCEQ